MILVVLNYLPQNVTDLTLCATIDSIYCKTQVPVVMCLFQLCNQCSVTQLVVHVHWWICDILCDLNLRVLHVFS